MLSACKKSGVGRSTFYHKRFIAEMMETDENSFLNLVDKEKCPEQLSKLYKQTLVCSPYKRTYDDLKKSVKLLP